MRRPEPKLDEALAEAQIKGLSAGEKKKLLTFKDFVDCEVASSIKYLRESDWDIQQAMELCLQQHPDHVLILLFSKTLEHLLYLAYTHHTRHTQYRYLSIRLMRIPEFYKI